MPRPSSGFPEFFWPFSHKVLCARRHRNRSLGYTGYLVCQARSSVGLERFARSFGSKQTQPALPWQAQAKERNRRYTISELLCPETAIALESGLVPWPGEAWLTAEDRDAKLSAGADAVGLARMAPLWCWVICSAPAHRHFCCASQPQPSSGAERTKAMKWPLPEKRPLCRQVETPLEVERRSKETGVTVPRNHASQVDATPGSGDLAQDSKGHTNSGFVLVPRACPSRAGSRATALACLVTVAAIHWTVAPRLKWHSRRLSATGTNHRSSLCRC